jgi:hypothetical protein
MTKSLVNKFLFISFLTFSITLGAQVVINRNGSTGGSGGGTPGGNNTEVQFNDSGAFGGDAGLTYNKTSNTLTTDIINLLSTGVALSSSNGTVTFTGLGGGGDKTFKIDLNDLFLINLTSTNADGVYFNGLVIDMYNEKTNTTSGDQSILAQLYFFGTNVNSEYGGVISEVTFSASEDIIYLFGLRAYADLAGSSQTAIDLVGVNVEVFLSASSNATNAYGFRLEDFDDSSSGAITNAYGLYLADVTVAGSTLNYAIFYNGPTTSDFGILATGVIEFGSAGVLISQDADGAIKFLGNSAGNDESLIINLDDGAANSITFSSDSSANLLLFTSISLQPAGYNSSDGSVGCTGTSTAVKNGISTSCVEPSFNIMDLYNKLSSTERTIDELLIRIKSLESVR